MIRNIERDRNFDKRASSVDRNRHWSILRSEELDQIDKEQF